MISKNELRDRITDLLDYYDVPDADEAADSFVEQLDDDGAFDPDTED